MQTAIPTKQLVQQVIEEAQKNENFFALQSIDTLLDIKFALKIEAL